MNHYFELISRSKNVFNCLEIHNLFCYYVCWFHWFLSRVINKIMNNRRNLLRNWTMTASLREINVWNARINLSNRCNLNSRAHARSLRLIPVYYHMEHWNELIQHDYRNSQHYKQPYDGNIWQKETTVLQRYCCSCSIWRILVWLHWVAENALLWGCCHRTSTRPSKSVERLDYCVQHGQWRSSWRFQLECGQKLIISRK